LRAAFDHSWRLLTDEDRKVFKKLSVFRGGFTREAAAQVAGAALKTLMTLVNKSLLRWDALTSRYDIHELLRQYGEQQINASPQESEHLHERHCEFYADYMQRQWRALMSLRQGAVLDEIKVEFDNVLKAWNYAVEKRKATVFRAMALSLWYYTNLRTSHLEAAELYARAAEALQMLPPEKETEIVLGHLLARQAWFFTETPSQALLGKALVEKSLAILGKHNCIEEMVIALDSLWLIVSFGLRQFDVAEQVARDALEMVRENPIQWILGQILTHNAYSPWRHGALIKAREIAEEGFRASEAIGDVWFMGVIAAHVLGPIAMDLGHYKQAETHFEQGLRWLKEVETGLPWHSAMACKNLGNLALLTKDYEKAKAWLKRSVDYYQKARQLNREYFEALCTASSLLNAQGQKEDAVQLLSVVQSHSAHPNIHDLVTVSLAELQTALPADLYAAAIERGKSLDLDMVVAEFLAS
jgi:tetratricopeptide (TPR) repeat protein